MTDQEPSANKLTTLSQLTDWTLSVSRPSAGNLSSPATYIDDECGEGPCTKGEASCE